MDSCSHVIYNKNRWETARGFAGPAQLQLHGRSRRSKDLICSSNFSDFSNVANGVRIEISISNTRPVGSSLERPPIGWPACTHSSNNRYTGLLLGIFPVTRFGGRHIDSSFSRLLFPNSTWSVPAIFCSRRVLIRSLVPFSSTCFFRIISAFSIWVIIGIPWLPITIPIISTTLMILPTRSFIATIRMLYFRKIPPWFTCIFEIWFG